MSIRAFDILVEPILQLNLPEQQLPTCTVAADCTQRFAFCVTGKHVSGTSSKLVQVGILLSMLLCWTPQQSSMLGFAGPLSRAAC